MINVLISHQIDTDVKISDSDIEKVVLGALSKLNIKNDLELEIIFVSEDEIKKLNKNHRSIDKPTDVLSFPQAQVVASKINIFGSIVICPAIASQRDESIEELIKHGILHLCGYDHEENESKWDEAARIVGSRL
jgi:probable rRNA maturation factor